MPAKPPCAATSPPPDDDSLRLVLEALTAMPVARRNALLSLVDFLFDLPKEQLALLAISVQPHLADEDVAGLCGVCVRTLYRWERFQSFKPRLEDYLESKRRQWSMPDDDAA